MAVIKKGPKPPKPKKLGKPPSYLRKPTTAERIRKKPKK